MLTNVADLSAFDVGDTFDSRTNPFEERGNVMEQPTHHEDKHDLEGKDQVEEVSSPISMPQGPITRSKSKKLQQALIHHLQGLVSLASKGLQGHQNFGTNEDQIQYNLIQVQVTNGFN